MATAVSDRRRGTRRHRSPEALRAEPDPPRTRRHVARVSCEFNNNIYTFFATAYTLQGTVTVAVLRNRPRGGAGPTARRHVARVSCEFNNIYTFFATAYTLQGTVTVAVLRNRPRSVPHELSPRAGLPAAATPARCARGVHERGTLEPNHTGLGRLQRKQI